MQLFNSFTIIVGKIFNLCYNAFKTGKVFDIYVGRLFVRDERYDAVAGQVAHCFDDAV